MSDQPYPYETFLDAASHGNALSYLYHNRGAIANALGYSPDKNWIENVEDISAGLVEKPFIGALEGIDYAMHSPALTLDKEAQHGLTLALPTLGLGMRGLGFTPRVPGLPSFPAFHGSGHLWEPAEGAPFGRFDPEKVNTGEGSQMEGWGLYTAKNIDAAKHYMREGLPLPAMGDGDISIDGRKIGYTEHQIMEHEDPGKFYALDNFALNDGNLENAIAGSRETADLWKAHEDEHFPADPARAKIFNDAADWLEKHGHRLQWHPASEGNLYQIWIHPEEHEFLDWDKKFTEQSPGVQQKISRLMDENFRQERPFGDALNNRTGKEIYESLQYRMFGPGDRYSIEAGQAAARKASELLDSYDIPGNSYLDNSTEKINRQWLLDGKPWSPVKGKDFREIDYPEADLADRLSFMNTRHDNGLTAKEALAEARRNLEDVIKEYPESASVNEIWKPQLEYLDKNEHRLSLGDPEKAVRNYVVFHPRNAVVIDRDGQKYGLQPVDHDPFK